jgi:hypothetical protein
MTSSTFSVGAIEQAACSAWCVALGPNLFLQCNERFSEFFMTGNDVRDRLRQAQLDHAFLWLRYALRVD